MFLIPGIAAAMVLTPSMAAVCWSAVESAFHCTVTTCRMVDGVPYLFCPWPTRIPAPKTTAAARIVITYRFMFSLQFFPDSRQAAQAAPIFAQYDGVGGIAWVVLHGCRTGH